MYLKNDEVNLANISFISFSFSALKNIKLIDPRVRCIYIATSNDLNIKGPFVTDYHIDLCSEYKIESISGLWWLFNNKVIKKANSKNIGIGLGMINSLNSFKHCAKYDIKELYTDNISFLKEYIFLYKNGYLLI